MRFLADTTYEININRIHVPELSVLSPELGEVQRPVRILKTKDGYSSIQVDLAGMKIYAVVQKVK